MLLEDKDERALQGEQPKVNASDRSIVLQRVACRVELQDPNSVRALVYDLLTAMDQQAGMHIMPGFGH